MRSRFVHEPITESLFEIESASARFPHALVDEKGAVYFDLATATEKTRQLLLRLAQPGDRIIRAGGRDYYSAALLRRHLPEAELERFDAMVEIRQQQAGRIPAPAAPAAPLEPRGGLLKRLARRLSASTNERSGTWH